MPPLSLPASLVARGVALRSQRNSDVPFLRGLYGANRAWELASVPWPEAAKQRFLDDQFRAQSAHFAAHHADADLWIVTRTAPPLADAAIGRLYLDRRGAMWRLLEIGLLPSEQRGGLGTEIVEFVKAAAVEAGATGVALQVAIDNRRAAALYQRLGFCERPGSSATHRDMEWRAVRRD